MVVARTVFPLLLAALFVLISTSPGYTAVVLPGLIGGDLTDPEDDINDNTADLFDGRASSGENFNWVQMEASGGNNYFGDPDGTSYEQGVREKAGDAFDNKLGGYSNKWGYGDSGWVAVDLRSQFILTHFTISSGNDSPGRDPDHWEIQGSNDGTNWVTIFDYDVEGVSPFSARSQVVRYDGAGVDFAKPSDYHWFRYEAFSSVSGGGQIGELEFFGVLVPEPSTLLIWSLLAGLGVGLGWRRRRTK